MFSTLRQQKPLKFQLNVSIYHILTIHLRFKFFLIINSSCVLGISYFLTKHLTYIWILWFVLKLQHWIFISTIFENNFTKVTVIVITMNYKANAIQYVKVFLT